MRNNWKSAGLWLVDSLPVCRWRCCLLKLCLLKDCTWQQIQGGLQRSKVRRPTGREVFQGRPLTETDFTPVQPLTIYHIQYFSSSLPKRSENFFAGCFISSCLQVFNGWESVVHTYIPCVLNPGPLYLPPNAQTLAYTPFSRSNLWRQRPTGQPRAEAMVAC